MSYKIDAAQLEDVAQLVALLHDLFGAEVDFNADPARQRRGLELLIAEAARSERVRLAVARDERGAVIGMASAQLVISTAEGAPSAWIEDVFVHPDFRGKGLGRLLLEHLLAWAKVRGATRAQLSADTANRGAELFYDALAWERTQLTVRRRFIV